MSALVIAMYAVGLASILAQLVLGLVERRLLRQLADAKRVIVYRHGRWEHADGSVLHLTELTVAVLADILDDADLHALEVSR